MFIKIINNKSFNTSHDFHVEEFNIDNLSKHDSEKMINIINEKGFYFNHDGMNSIMYSTLNYEFKNSKRALAVKRFIRSYKIDEILK